MYVQNLILINELTVFTSPTGDGTAIVTCSSELRKGLAFYTTNGSSTMSICPVTAIGPTPALHSTSLLAKLTLKRFYVDVIFANYTGFSIEGGTRRLIAAYFGIYSRLLCV